jgi:FkbM family methyltransferase
MGFLRSSISLLSSMFSLILRGLRKLTERSRKLLTLIFAPNVFKLSNPSDLFPFHLHQLQKSTIFNPTGVIHVGAHDGAEVPFYRSLGLAKIYLFEPQLKYAQLLRNRYGRDRRVEVFSDALGSSAIHSEIFTEIEGSPNRSASASLLRPKQHLQDFDYVQFNLTSPDLVTVSTLDSFGIVDADLLVIDTQGYELEVLKGALLTLAHVKWIIFEYWANEAYEGNPTEHELLSFLAEYAFLPVLKSYDRTFGDYLVARREFIR